MNAVKRHRKKKSPSAMSCSRRRSARFLEKKSTGKQDLASPEDKQSITAVPRSREQESEIDLSGRKRDSASLEKQKQNQASESDLALLEQAILQEFVNTLSDSEDDSNGDRLIVRMPTAKMLNGQIIKCE